MDDLERAVGLVEVVNIPIEVRTALRLGPPPGFHGPRCTDCGTRHHLETDHTQPLSRGGPTALRNTQHRCFACHLKKTTLERRGPLPGEAVPPLRIRSPNPCPFRPDRRAGLDGRDTRWSSRPRGPRR